MPTRWNNTTAPLAVLLTALATAAGAGAADAPVKSTDGFDWTIWKGIAVQDGGRIKPLDTLATESLIAVTSERKHVRPENPGTISAVEIVDWTGLAKMLTAGDGTSPAVKRVAGLLTADLRSKLTATDFDVAPHLAVAVEARAQLKKLQERHLDEHSDDVSMAGLRKLIQSGAVTDEMKPMLDLVQQIDARVEKVAAVGEVKAQLVRELNELVAFRDLYQPEPFKTVLKDGTGSLNFIQLGETNRALLGEALAPAVSLAPTKPTAFGAVELQDRKYEPLELYVTLLLTWQGWDELKDVKQLTEGGGGRDDQLFFKFHQPDAWDRLPLLDARHIGLKPWLLPETVKAASAQTALLQPAFEDWWQAVAAKKDQGEETLSPVEEKGLGIVQSAIGYTRLRMGLSLQVGPTQTKENDRWIPLVGLLLDNPAVGDYPSDQIKSLRDGFQQARKGLLTK
ncbi:MAG: hypothetical protein ACRC1K_07020, partial [Planctomycetia bacterium]